MVDIKNIPARLKSDCRFCVWKFEKRSGQKTKMPYNPANGERAKINDMRTFTDFKTTLMTYAMGGYDGIGIAVGNGIGAFDIDHCFREDGTLNDTAATVLSVFPTAYVEKSPFGEGLRGFFGVPEDFVYDKTVYYINNRSKGLEVYMPGATNRFVTVTGDIYRTGEIPNDETAMTTLLDSLMKRKKQVQNTQLRHHSYLDDDAVIAHAEGASNSDKFKRLFAGDWEDLYDSQSDADMALLSILAFWCGCDEEQMDRIFRTSGLMRDKWDRQQAGTTYGAISIRNAVNNIPKAQLVIADIPYNIGSDFYASRPDWYVDGDNRNGESDKARKAAFNTDFTFNIAEYFHFCNRLLKKEPMKGEKGAPCMIVFCAFQQIPKVITEAEKYGFKNYIPLTFCKNYSPQVLKANMKIVGATEYALVLYRGKLPKFNNVGEDGKSHMIFNWFDWKRDGKDYPKIHPSQKPVSVLKRLIEIFTDPGDVVIDPCAGSGATLRAARELGRNSYGFEVSRDFYLKAKEQMLGEESV